MEIPGKWEKGGVRGVCTHEKELSGAAARTGKVGSKNK